MRNKIFLLFFFLIIGCGSNIGTEIDINSLKKEGIKIFDSTDSVKDNSEISKISSIALVKQKTFKGNDNWNYPYYNLTNTIPHLSLSNNYKINQNKIFNFIKNNNFEKQILHYQSKIIFIDDFSNITLLNDNMSVIKKIKIYNKNDFKNYPLRFSLAINNNTLFITDNLGSIMAFNLISFDFVWKKNLSVPFLSNIIFFKENIFVINANNKIYSFSIKDGTQNWSYETGTETIKSLETYRLVLFENKLIFTNDLGLLFCLDLERQVILWNLRILSSDNINNSNILKISNLVAEKQSLYISSNLGIFFKINIDNGQIIWKKNINSHFPIIINPSSVSLVDVNGFFYILDKFTGEYLFKKKISNIFNQNNNGLVGIKVSNFFLSSNNFNIMTNYGDIITIAANKLENITTKKISNEVRSNIIFLNNEAFFIGEKNSIYRLK